MAASLWRGIRVPQTCRPLLQQRGSPWALFPPRYGLSRVVGARAFGSRSSLSEKDVERMRLRHILQEIDLPEYLERFEEEQVNFADLKALSAEDWRELIPELGPRNRIKRAVQQELELQANLSDPDLSDPDVAEATGSESPAASAAAAASDSQRIWDLSFNELHLPQFFPDMEEGVILGWYKQVGDRVRAGTSLCKVDTELAVISFDALEDGYLAAVMIPDGKVKVGGVLGVLVQRKEDIARAQQAHGLSSSKAQRLSQSGLLDEVRQQLEAERLRQEAVEQERTAALAEQEAEELAKLGRQAQEDALETEKLTQETVAEKLAEREAAEAESQSRQ